VVVVVVLPFLQFVVERADVAEDNAVEQAAELLRVDAGERSTSPLSRGVAGRM
jgi:hypothetical protein